MSANNPNMQNPNNDDNASVFASNANDELMEHEYDGIQEYDNPLPGWWKWLFVATILFAFPYWAYYHFGGSGRSIPDTYSVASAQVARLLFATMGEMKPDRATLVKFMTEQDGLDVGRGVFKANCVSCHGSEGQGMVGPNLTDKYYKNVKDIEDIIRVVNNGAGGGAMPPWLNRLDEMERILVSSYVASLRGTDASGGKLAEGKEIAAWPTADEVAADDEAAEAELESETPAVVPENQPPAQTTGLDTGQAAASQKTS